MFRGKDREKGSGLPAVILFFLLYLLPLIIAHPEPASFPGPGKEHLSGGYQENLRPAVLRSGLWRAWGPVLRDNPPVQVEAGSLGKLLPVRRFPPLLPPARETPVPVAPAGGPRVAIIVDDVGFVRAPVEAFFPIQAPLTMAVLPWGEYSQEHARRAKAAGFEVILHLPLEPLDPEICPGPGAVYGDASPEEIRRQIRANINNVPEVVGVNNHMGSKGTQDPVLMRLLMEELKANGLFFVDSLTIGSSVAGQTARKQGVPVTERDIFLDHYGVEDIPRQMEKLLQKAVAKGKAVGIVHPHPGAAGAVADFLPRFAEAGVALVPVSDLVE